MAKSAMGYKTTKTENSKFHGAGPGNKGMADNAAPAAKSVKKGDSRSKSYMAGIKPSKGC